MLAGSLVDPSAPQMLRKGDPSESFSTAVEQYRTRYLFLAPDDYDVSFADVVAPIGAQLTLDGAPVTAALDPIGGRGFGVARINLGPGLAGAHELISNKRIGLQVIGYGSYTSYQYPGGLDLKPIAPPPPK
jgi:hypothetical protein